MIARVFALLLGVLSFAQVAQAQEKVPATATPVEFTTQWRSSASAWGMNRTAIGTAQEACADFVAAVQGYGTVTLNAARPNAGNTQAFCDVKFGPFGDSWEIQGVPSCPYGTWLEGSQCIKYTCPEGTEGPDGAKMCAVNKCASKKGKDVQGRIAVVKGQAFYTGDVCIDGCSALQSFRIDGGDPTIGLNGMEWWPVSQWYSGAACTGQPDGSAPTGSEAPDKKPPCASGDGVMTTTTGKILCVPQGTPDARKPEIEKKKEVETYPDGTSKETETTKTRDPLTGVTDVSKSSTSTGGQSGPAGTTTSTSSSGSGVNGDGDGDEPCDPAVQWCDGPKTEGLYAKKEETFKGPLQRFADGVKASLLGNNVSAFFTVTIPSGTCPNWVLDIAYFNKSIPLAEYFCHPMLVEAMEVIGQVLMIVAAFSAFRWAIL